MGWLSGNSAEKEESVRQRQKLRRELEHQKEIMLAEFDKKMKKSVSFKVPLEWCDCGRLSKEQIVYNETQEKSTASNKQGGEEAEKEAES